MNRVAIRICRVPGTPETPLPSYQTDGAAGMDIYAAIMESMTIPAGGRGVVPTGFCIAVPGGYEAQVRPRSGLARDFGITVANSPGTIDADYRGEVQIILINHGTADFLVQHGDRVAQLVIAPVAQAHFEVVAELSQTVRGGGGFGHTSRQ